MAEICDQKSVGNCIGVHDRCGRVHYLGRGLPYSGCKLKKGGTMGKYVYEVTRVPKHDDDFFDFVYSEGFYLDKKKAKKKRDRLRAKKSNSHMRVSIRKHELKG